MTLSALRPYARHRAFNQVGDGTRSHAHQDAVQKRVFKQPAQQLPADASASAGALQPRDKGDERDARHHAHQDETPEVVAIEANCFVEDVARAHRAQCQSVMYHVLKCQSVMG